MNEEILRKISMVDNMKSLFWGRIILGILFLIYVAIILIFGKADTWTKLSIALAFAGLGLMFILDGQNVLREYFSSKPPISSYTGQKSVLFLIIMKILLVAGSILFLVKFYQLNNPSMYPITIFLISIFLIILFQNKISHFELSKERLLVKMKEDNDEEYNNIEQKKKEMGFQIIPGKQK
jgi:hypothetical protein